MSPVALFIPMATATFAEPPDELYPDLLIKTHRRMNMRRAIRKRCWFLVIAILSITSLFCWSQAYAHAGHTGVDDPWKADELIQPADLVQLLASDEKPLVVQVGIIHLFKLGHIPGAQY